MKKNRDSARRFSLGIRGRLMLDLAIFVAFVIVLLWVLQIYLLDDFYRSIKTKRMTTAANAISESIGTLDLQDVTERLAANEEISVLLLDEQYSRVLSLESSNNSLIHKMSRDEIAWWCAKTAEDGTALLEYFTYSPRRQALTENEPLATPPDLAVDPGDKRPEHKFHSRWVDRIPDSRGSAWQSLLCVKRISLENGENGYLLLNMLITPVNATVSTLREQLMLVSLLVVLFAGLLALLLARRFSRPIVDTNRAARELSHASYTVPGSAESYREIAELNETLSKAAVELNQVENLQHELIANISHDLRTPLTMIGGYAELMRDIPDERTPENMQIVIDETKRLSSLVTELLDFSRLEAGAAEIRKEPFNLTAVILDIQDRNNAIVEKQGYRILFRPDREETAIGDATRIQQVVYNLMNNALTYTGTDKTVRIVQRITPENRVRIEIQDSGDGIPEEEIPLIWNRYYRAKENHKRAVQGSGLGLSIVRSILESHGAPFGVESRQGKGSTFWFELDRCSQADEKNREAALQHPCDENEPDGPLQA